LLQGGQYLGIARAVATRLKRKYQWIPADDLYSYALFGLVQAANAYDPDRNVPFPAYASKKALYAAIDEMRKDHLLSRVGLNPRPDTVSLERLLTGDQKDWQRLCNKTARKSRSRLEARDWCATVLSQLSSRDRQILMLRYADDMTFREIGKVMGVSESTVCLRHNALIMRFRRLANKAGSQASPRALMENTS
jgi:RNA polymerase sigma factor for flagellar operon FliA